MNFRDRVSVGGSSWNQGCLAPRAVAASGAATATPRRSLQRTSRNQKPFD